MTDNKFLQLDAVLNDGDYYIWYDPNDETFQHPNYLRWHFTNTIDPPSSIKRFLADATPSSFALNFDLSKYVSYAVFAGLLYLGVKRWKR